MTTTRAATFKSLSLMVWTWALASSVPLNSSRRTRTHGIRQAGGQGVGQAGPPIGLTQEQSATVRGETAVSAVGYRIKLCRYPFFASARPLLQASAEYPYPFSVSLQLSRL